MSIVVYRRNSVSFLMQDQRHVRTPGGLALGSRDDAWVVSVAEECERLGPNPIGVWSRYALTCSYLDFGLNDRHGDLVEAVLSDNSDPDLHAMQNGRYGKSSVASRTFLDRIRSGEPLQNIVKSNHFTMLLQHSLEDHFMSVSMHTLMAMVYAGAHFRAPLLIGGFLAGEIPARKVQEKLPFVTSEQLEDLIAFSCIDDDRDQVLCA